MAASEPSGVNPFDLGLPWPKSTSMDTYTNPESRGLNPNALKGGGVMNAHYMPTGCITGMAPSGLHVVNKSGPPVVVSGFFRGKGGNIYSDSNIAPDRDSDESRRSQARCSRKSSRKSGASCRLR